MPLAIVIVVRLCRAIVGTIRLLTDVEVMKALPWAYIRRLPFRSAWVALSTLCLFVSAGGLITSAILAGAQNVTIYAAITGLVVSYLRAVARRKLTRR